MKPEEIRPLAIVINKKYGTEEQIIGTDILMKDSQKEWIPAVLYCGPDRFNPSEKKIFCKDKEDFLKEFELRQNIEPIKPFSMTPLLEFTKVEEVEMDVLKDMESEPGVLYICKEYETSAHLCPCGCGTDVVSFDDMTIKDGKVTIDESFQNPCGAHYFIINNKIVWV